MAAYEEKTGGSVLAIAHNGNLSNGRMFPIVESFTASRSTASTPRRARSGSGSTRRRRPRATARRIPFLSPNDEFADFERWDKGNLDGSVAKTKEMLEFEYARSALKNGLKLEQQLGANPYKFGLIGSTDAHTGLAAMEEDNFFGKTTPQEPSPERLTQTFVDNPKTGVQDHGLGGRRLRLRRRVGHREHARGDLRRDAAQGDLRHHRPAHGRALLRRLGLRRGGRARPRSRRASATPRACRWAATCARRRRARRRPSSSPRCKDPIGANLDRIQIVKGWLDAKGELQEKVYDVAWSRRPQARREDGKLPPVGSTVDVANATWTNTIGAPELIAVWKDPDFDPAQRAFYYARVIEIPTPRWTAYDAKRFGIKPLPEHADDDHRARLHLADLVHAELTEPAVISCRRARALRPGRSPGGPCTALPGPDRSRRCSRGGGADDPRRARRVPHMVPIEHNSWPFRTDSLDRARARGAISAFVMTTRTPTRPDVLSSVGVRLSLRVLLLLGILPGGFVV